MDIRLLKTTGELTTQGEFKKFAQDCARVCYSDKEWEDLEQEAFNSGLVDKRIIPSGHHSVFEHMNLTFYFEEMPKALVMAFNNEKQYATSEKSARYTQMDSIEPLQKELYDKWMGILEPKIKEVASEENFPKLYQQGSDGKTTAQKLAQENARYMTSVFTPTKMVHTLNLRQLNFIMNQFESFSYKSDETKFNKSLAMDMAEFNSHAYPIFGVPGLQNQTDRHLSLFGKGLEQLTGSKVVDEHFGHTYSTMYPLSFAGLAQAQRHRTIDYHIVTGTAGTDMVNEYFVPKLIRNDLELLSEWVEDLSKVSETDFPQGQLLMVAERGKLEDFRSKAILRLCGHAQYEIMESTKGTAQKYAASFPTTEDWVSPKCQQGMHCAGSCAWGGKYALERAL